jgi:hypothetical protein
MITFLDLGNYGRFGNQLWQIASTIGIATKNNHEYAFPAWQYQSFFKNKLPELYVYNINNVYKEQQFHYEDINLGIGDWNLQGYFQSYKYFNHCEDLIKKHFFFPKLSLKGVAIHVRRGDYLDRSGYHSVQGMEYYEEAFKHFGKEKFTVFSDDIQWCKENFKGNRFDFFEQNGNDFLDFSYMSGFDKFIIANSSYSWWAAYLGEGKEVIAPKKWFGPSGPQDFEDVYLPTWIKL